MSTKNERTAFMEGPDMPLETYNQIQ